MNNPALALACPYQCLRYSLLQATLPTFLPDSKPTAQANSLSTSLSASPPCPGPVTLPPPPPNLAPTCQTGYLCVSSPCFRHGYPPRNPPHSLLVALRTFLLDEQASHLPSGSIHCPKRVVLPPYPVPLPLFSSSKCWRQRCPHLGHQQPESRSHPPVCSRHVSLPAPPQQP